MSTATKTTAKTAASAKLDRATVAPKAPKAPKAPPAPAKAPRAAKVEPKAAKINRTREAAPAKAPRAAKAFGGYQITILAKDANGHSKSLTTSGIEAGSLEEALYMAPAILNKKLRSK